MKFTVMGAIVSILYTVVVSPVVIGVCAMLRNMPVLQKIKWIYVLVISAIIWLIALSQAGFSTGPDERKLSKYSMVISFITSLVVVASTTFLILFKK